jgi:hypothetical protein
MSGLPGMVYAERADGAFSKDMSKSILPAGTQTPGGYPVAVKEYGL